MYDHGVECVTGFVLAGGRSSRMGRDKALLQLGGKTLLARALEVIGRVATSTCIVGDAGKFGRFGPVVEDLYPQRGPLGGIHAALLGSGTELNLILAVDMPFVRSDFLTYLVSVALTDAAIVVVPGENRVFQPLCAVYRRSFAEVAEKSLQRGRNKIDTLFAKVRTRVVTSEEMAAQGFGEGMFRNLNTAEDWEEAKLVFESPTPASQRIMSKA